MKQSGEVTLYFGRHISRSDGRSIPLDQCEVFAPEFAGWTMLLKHVYEEVSTGRLSVARAARLMEESEGSTFHDFQIGQFSVLSATRKRVLMLDWPHDHPKLRHLIAVSDVGEMLPPRMQPFAAAHATVGRQLRDFSVLQIEREHHIADRIGEIVPGLNGKRLLMSIGASHTNLALLLVRRGIRVRRLNQLTVHPFSPKDQAVRYVSWGMAIPYETAAHHILWGMLSDWYFPQNQAVTSRHWVKIKATQLLKEVADALTEPQIAELWDNCRMSPVPEKELRSTLKHFGVVLPEQIV